MEPQILGIIPARGGSKGIPRKNLFMIDNRPLIAYSIEESKKSRYLTRLIVSTDDEEIASVAKQYGAEVPFLRSKEMGGDNVPLVPNLITHVLEQFEKIERYSPDFLVMLQPTCPLRTAKNIDDCIEKVLDGKSDWVTTINEAPIHPYRTRLTDGDKLVPLLTDPIIYAQRQDLPKAVVFNGAVYATSRASLKSAKPLHLQSWRGVEISKQNGFDIDSLGDIQTFQALIHGRPYENK
jgi:CMP-N-acetylneuraminic acid synthetase